MLLLVHGSNAPPDDSIAAPVELLEAAEAWFRAVSYGRLELRVDTLPRWLALPARSTEYVADPGRYLADAVAAADAYVWDLMAGRWPSELLAWHRWKLGWLDESQVACMTGRTKQTVTLSPIERSGGAKAVFGGRRIFAVEARARTGYDRTLCDARVLVYSVDQTRSGEHPCGSTLLRATANPPAGACAGMRNAPFDLSRNENRSLRLSGFHVDVLARRPGGVYRIRVTAR